MNPIVRFSLKAVLPSGGALKGICETDVETFMRHFKREAPPMLRVGLLVASWVLVLSPPLTIKKPLPAFLLSPRLLDEHVQQGATHSLYPMRMAFMGVKMVAGLCWGQDRDVRIRLGAPPLEPDPGTWKEGM